MERAQQLALYLGQLDGGAVTALEARVADLHLLALYAWRDAASEDDGLGLSDLAEQVGR